MKRRALVGPNLNGLATMKYVLERITTEFSPLEDRIKLVSQVGGEGSITILITRRMLALVLPTLLERVNSAVAVLPNQRAASAAAESASAAGYESMRHEFAQLAANEQLAPAVPVKAVQGGATVLPSAVDLKASKDALILVFRDDSDTMATLALEDVQLRQWLQMLYKCAERQGGWQLPQWPTWLSGTNLSKVPQGLAVH